MAKKNKKKKSNKEKDDASRTISENRKARHKFEIIEQIECGISLQGSEVKSIRDGKVSLDEAYARIMDRELFLVGCDIAEYKQATIWNHAPKRIRKLLVHKKQLEKLIERAFEKGLTLTPLRMYINSRGIIKIMLGVCRGKKLHDKRETLKKQEAKRHVDREMKKANRRR